MRMIEPGDGAGFGQVTVGSARVFNQFAVWHFDRHLPFELFIPRQIDQPISGTGQFAQTLGQTPGPPPRPVPWERSPR